MISTWIKKTKEISPLSWVRLGAAGTLLFLTYWIFLDLNINLSLFKTLIPLSYLFKFQIVLPKKTSFLLLPILANIALWTPCYYSYIFLRMVIYAERIKLYIVIGVCIVLSVLAIVFGHPNGISDTIGDVFVYLFIAISQLYWNIAIQSSMKTEVLKRRFQVEHMSDQILIKKIRLMLVIFFIVAYFIYF